eukprot:jgi/Psemu1/323052/estExt_fgenesh1_pg.C_540018
MGFSMFLGYVLAFSESISESAIIPIELNILLAILVPFCAMLFPTLMFTFGTLVLPLCSVFLLIQILATILSAIAIQFGNAAFVVAFFAVSFWVSFTSTGPSPNGLPPLIEEQLFLLLERSVAAAIDLGVGTHFIEIGSDAATSDNNNNNDSGSALSALYGRTAEISVYDYYGGDYGGSVSTETYIEGGTWLLAEAWNLSGGYTLRNPFAKHVHILVLSLWLTLVLSLAILMPPFRTMRGAVWRGIIPAAMIDASGSIRLHANRLRANANANANANSPPSGKGQPQRKRKRKRQRRKPKNGSPRGEGNLAKYSVFEPRLLACKPPEWTVSTLVQLSGAVSRCVRIAVGIELLAEPEADAKADGGTDAKQEQGQRQRQRQFLRDNTQLYLEIADTLEQCAKAVRSGDANLLTKLELEPAKGDEAADKAEDSAAAKDAESVSPREHSYDPFHFRKHTNEVVTLSKRWLEAMSPAVAGGDKTCCSCSSESFFAFQKNGWPWIWTQCSHFVFLGTVLTNLFRKFSWQALLLHPSQNNALPQVVWCAKYALGMTLLLVFLIYWPAFRENFVIATEEDDPYRSLFALQNGGWAIVAYGFATTQTVEGSVKKGLLRMAGTVTGALSAWLALVACEDQRFPFHYNTYGIVAWLTATSFVATFVSTERGFAARVGLSSDFAYGPIYFVITQVIIVGYGYYYYQEESRYEITINRMVANLVGIAMAIVLAIVPPGIWGGDPSHCLSMVRYHQSQTARAIELVLSLSCPDDAAADDKDLDKRTAANYNPVTDAGSVAADLRVLSEEIRSHSSALQEQAVDFEKDASKLRSLPLFRVDPRLKTEIARVTRDIHIAAFVPLLAAAILLDGEKRGQLLRSESRYRKDLETLLGEMAEDCTSASTSASNSTSTKSATATAIPAIQSFAEPASTDAETDSELLVRTIVWLWEETKQHKTVLGTIQWGVF